MAQGALAGVYSESDLRGLIGKPVPVDAFLVGTFVCLSEHGGKFVFSTFSRDDGTISFGPTLLSVRFTGTPPPNLAVGKLIVPKPSDRMRIKAVQGSTDGKLLLVVCESP